MKGVVSISQKYTKAGLMYLFGNIFNKGVAFLTVPIFTRILSADEYGIVNTYTATVGILSILIGMSLHMSIRTAFIDYLEEIEDFMRSIIMLVITSLVIFLSVSFAIIIVFNLNINLTIMVLCILHGSSSAIITNYSTYLMMKFSYKKRTLILVLPNLISVLLSVFAILVLFNTNRYMGKIIPTALTTTIFALVIIIRYVWNKEKKISTKYWRYAMGISLPIILHALSLNILNQSDRIMITTLKNSAETGIYSLIYNFSMIANIFIISIEGIWVPWFTKNISEKNIRQINEKAVYYIDVISLAILGIILVSPEVLRLLAPQEYWIGISIIPPIVLSSYIIFIYTMYVNVEHYHKKTKHIALNTIIAATTNVILNYIFIPQYGMYAAAATTLLSYLISLVLHYNFSKKIERDLFPFKIFIKSLGLIVFSIIIFYLFVENVAVRLGFCIILVIRSVIKNKKELLKLINIKAKKEA